MKIYLDNNATTRLDDEVFESMIPFFKEEYGNAFSLHLFGQETGKAVAEARKKVADVVGALPEEIIFTGSGTESDNIAVRGIARAYKNRGKHIIVSAIEHPGIRNTCKDLESEGFEVTVIGVNKNGVVKDIKVHQKVIQNIVIFANKLGFKIINLTYSPIKGPAGNIEYLLYIEKNENNLLDLYETKKNAIQITSEAYKDLK